MSGGLRIRKSLRESGKAAKITLRLLPVPDDNHSSIFFSTFPVMIRFSLLTAVASIFSLSLTGCNTLDKITEPQPKNNAADANAVVPSDFLFTRYAPLNQWLDEAVRVQIIDVPLMEVFNHPALRGLQYVVVKAPPVNPLVTIDKIALTRRQLLWVLSHDHQLHMTPAFNNRGAVTNIEIRSRSIDLPNAQN